MNNDFKFVPNSIGFLLSVLQSVIFENLEMFDQIHKKIT